MRRIGGAFGLAFALVIAVFAAAAVATAGARQLGNGDLVWQRPAARVPESASCRTTACCAG